jgi:hypothetical protein
MTLSKHCGVRVTCAASRMPVWLSCCMAAAAMAPSHFDFETITASRCGCELSGLDGMASAVGEVSVNMAWMDPVLLCYVPAVYTVTACKPCLCTSASSHCPVILL